MINVAINGFGRIGRNFLRAVLQDKSCHKKIRVVAINVGSANLQSVAHMFKHDTLMGDFPDHVKIKNKNELEINGYRVTVLTQMDPRKIEWYKFGVDWVVEATGKFTCRKDAQLHVESGAKNVLITAPATEADVTIIPGVNYQDYDPQTDHIVSLGSCTTNAIMPMLKILHEQFIVKNGFMTTIHAYTNTQVLLDVEKKDLRKSRAAALNIIPTSTGAMRVLGEVMPDLKDLIGGIAVRVPVAKVSLIDFTFLAKEIITKEKINHAFEYAAKASLKGILDISYEPLVSSDYSGNNNSVIIDGLLTDVKSQQASVFGWYDNEWGYSVRLKDFLIFVACVAPGGGTLEGPC